jgi:hypothetical protein
MTRPAALKLISLAIASGCGPAPSPLVTPTPSMTIRPPQTTPVATSNSTAQPPAGAKSSPGQTPQVTPGTSIDALLSHVPESLRGSCSPATGSAAVIARVTCPVDGGTIMVAYAAYADQAAMTADYEAQVIAAGIEDASGRCYNTNGDGTFSATKSRWPSENGYTINDESVGRYLCYESGTPTVAWTDDRLYILAVATTSSTDVDRLITFWVNEAGPFE